MIRLYRRTVETLFICMAFIQREGYTFRDIYRSFAENRARGTDTVRGMNPDLENKIRTVVASSPERDHEDVADLVEKIGNQIFEREKFKDKDLIDALVQVLKLPWAPNILSARILGDLKRAMLIPSEMAVLAERLRSMKDLSCYDCGRTLQIGEMMTLSFPEQGLLALHCTNCMTPVLVACNNCKGTAEISDKAIKRISSGFRCPACKGEKVEKGADIGPDAVDGPTPIGTFGTIDNNLTAAQAQRNWAIGNRGLNGARRAGRAIRPEFTHPANVNNPPTTGVQIDWRGPATLNRDDAIPTGHFFEATADVEARLDEARRQMDQARMLLEQTRFDAGNGTIIADIGDVVLPNGEIV